MDAVKLYRSETNVLSYLRRNRDRWISPTEIGKEVGGYVVSEHWTGLGRRYLRHSAWASPICLRLVKKGWAVRNKRGWYRVHGWRPK